MKIRHFRSTFPKEVIASTSKIDQKYFKYCWNDQLWENLPEASFLSLLYVDEELVAFTLFNLNIHEELGHLLKICVLPSYRGRGLSTMLLKETICKIKNIDICRFYLEVEVDNVSAIGLYKKIGFSPLNIIKKFYSDGANALAMNIE